VIGAPKKVRVAELVSAQHVSSVPAHIQQHVDVAVLASGDDYRLPSYRRRFVITQLSQFTLMTNVYPTPFENVPHFVAKNILIYINTRMDAEVE
jgi:hypothetical protein